MVFDPWGGEPQATEHARHGVPVPGSRERPSLIFWKMSYLEFPYNMNQEHNQRARISFLGEEVRNRTRYQ
jgi:hypothetical protein